ncbi:hypothetical protein ALC62_00112 [Cyphomyrmex costatus]|uniref:RING-type domain-containing protein n=1 Tax=Cyphomyrmex costatus TaxID=456900 RepID=A0A151K1T3_9HYME|nr:hypothetical protein ALC62_00112 [Cyphomyrmex costatus]
MYRQYAYPPLSFLPFPDPSIYEDPDDDYGYLDTNTNASTSTKEHSFHPVDWNIDTLKKNSELNNCTVCYENERTHLFTPCNHLACCIDCIERLETNRCPICNQVYNDYIRVLKP